MSRRTRTFARLICSMAMLVLAALLVWQTTDMYFTGSANRNEAGVLLAPIFTRNAVAARLYALRWPIGLCMAVILLCTCLVRSEMPRGKRVAPAHRAPEPRTPRLVLLAAAVVLILLGVFNGGLYDVLVKAINICTECIGLG